MNKVISVIRTIHPVGQGAFYTEEFFDIDHNRVHTVVFDCGSKTKIGRSNCINKVVSGAFVKRQIIDILFISHFDTDHVNGISELLKHGRHINFVVLPQLEGMEWFYTIEAACYSDENLRTTAIRVYNLRPILENAGAHVLQVRPISSNELERALDNHTKAPDGDNPEYMNDNENGNGIPGIDEIGDGKGMIDSGTVFGMVANPRWIYVPVNFTYGRDIEVLRNKIQAILTADGKYHGKFIENLTSAELCDFIERNRKAINDVYDAVFPSTNASSLCVYSGMNKSLDSKRSEIFITTPLYCIIDMWDEPYYWDDDIDGCLYTGDSVMTKGKSIAKLQFVFNSISRWKDRLGTFQLPHHGSKENLGKDSLDFLFDTNNPQCHCPLHSFASFGSTNNYGHPSDSLISLLSTYPAYFISVTEVKHTALRQRIDVLY